MYKGINLNWTASTSRAQCNYLDCLLSEFGEYHYSSGQYDKEKKMTNQALDKYIQLGDNEKLSGDVIQKDWFPIEGMDVFISHSHKDIEVALRMKFLLENLLGLRVFVDSAIWGNANDLLKQLDQKYCLMDSGNYDYDKRNNTTSIVHIMLAEALTQMMNKCECVFFLNTSNSILKEGYGSQEQTSSPWIYHELLMTKFLKENKPHRLLPEERKRHFDSVEVAYNVDLSHLSTLSMDNFSKWIFDMRRLYISQNVHPLDRLYEILNIK